MGTTPNGYPYPEDTDLVNQGAQAVKALATAVDTQLRKTASGVASHGREQRVNRSNGGDIPRRPVHRTRRMSPSRRGLIRGSPASAA